jgi:cytochrome c peroxidase
VKNILSLVVLIGCLFIASQLFVTSGVSTEWSSRQIDLLKSLSLSALPKLEIDPSNSVAEDRAAAEFGHTLFFDVRLSGDNTIACATCHQPKKMFTDGLPLAAGTKVGPRHTPSLVGLAYSPWFYWDGRKDSQWAQALAPLETSHEHNTNRLEIARLIDGDKYYSETYSILFGNLPEIPQSPKGASPAGNIELKNAWDSLNEKQQFLITEVFANVGKALAAYQRKIMPGRGRFDNYVDALDEDRDPAGESLTSEEVAGLALFIGKAQCVTCHNGPLLTNNEFHNTGVLPITGQLPSMGRYDGVRFARADPFNCLGKYSDANPKDCLELTFANDTNDLVGAQKTPTLRNIKETAPYMHGGQLKTLLEVVNHYNEAPVSLLSHNESKPLGLSAAELQRLEAFMNTLSAPLATEEKWLNPP